MCKKWIEKHKISEARSSLFYVLLMNVHGIGSANHKSALKEKGDNVSNNAEKKNRKMAKFLKVGPKVPSLCSSLPQGGESLLVEAEFPCGGTLVYNKETTEC